MYVLNNANYVYKILQIKFVLTLYNPLEKNLPSRRSGNSYNLVNFFNNMLWNLTYIETIFKRKLQLVCRLAYRYVCRPHCS